MTTIKYKHGKINLTKNNIGYSAILFKNGEIIARVIITGKNKNKVIDYSDIILKNNFDGYPFGHYQTIHI